MSHEEQAMLPRMRTRSRAKQAKLKLEAEKDGAVHRPHFERKQVEQDDGSSPSTSDASQVAKRKVKQGLGPEQGPRLADSHSVDPPAFSRASGEKVARIQAKKSKDARTNSKNGLPTGGRSTPSRDEQTSSKQTEVSKHIFVFHQWGVNALYLGTALLDTSVRSAYGSARGFWCRLLRGELLPSIGLVLSLLKWIGILLVLVAAIPLLISLYASDNVLMQPLFWAIGLFHRSTSGVCGCSWISPFCSLYCTTLPSFAAYTMSAAFSKYVDVARSGCRHPITIEGITYPDSDGIYSKSNLPRSLIFSLTDCYEHQVDFERFRDGIIYPDKDLLVAMQADMCLYLRNFSTSLPEYYSTINVWSDHILHQVDVTRSQTERVLKSTGDDPMVEQKLLKNKMASLQAKWDRKYARLLDPGLALTKELDDALNKNTALIKNITQAYSQTEKTRLAKRAEFGIARRLAKRIGMLPEYSTELAPYVEALEAMRIWNDSATAIGSLFAFINADVSEVNSNWNQELKRTMAAKAKFELGEEEMLEMNAYMNGIRSQSSEMQRDSSDQSAKMESTEPRADADNTD